MNKDKESLNKTMADKNSDKQSDFLNMFANYSVFMDMVKRTAIDTAEAIVKRELLNFFSGFCEGLEGEEDTETLNDLEELKRL